jgi:hypothetical protein
MIAHRRFLCLRAKLEARPKSRYCRSSTSTENTCGESPAPATSEMPVFSAQTHCADLHFSSQCPVGRCSVVGCGSSRTPSDIWNGRQDDYPAAPSSRSCPRETQNVGKVAPRPLERPSFGAKASPDRLNSGTLSPRRCKPSHSIPF